MTTSNGNGSKFVNTTIASAAYAFLLTFGFVWTSLHAAAPFSVYAEGLGGGLLIVVGKRLAQKSKVFGGGCEDKDGDGECDEEKLPVR